MKGGSLLILLIYIILGLVAFALFLAVMYWGYKKGKFEDKGTFKDTVLNDARAKKYAIVAIVISVICMWTFPMLIIAIPIFAFMLFRHGPGEEGSTSDAASSVESTLRGVVKTVAGKTASDVIFGKEKEETSSPDASPVFNYDSSASRTEETASQSTSSEEGTVAAQAETSSRGLSLVNEAADTAKADTATVDTAAAETAATDAVAAARPVNENVTMAADIPVDADVLTKVIENAERAYTAVTRRYEKGPFEYKCVPAPAAVELGHKETAYDAVNRYFSCIEDATRDGWELFQTVEAPIITSAPSGCLAALLGAKDDVTIVNMIVYRRKL